MVSSRVLSLLSIAAAVAFIAAAFLISEPVRLPWLALGFMLLELSFVARISKV
jgi:hypothetical protein